MTVLYITSSANLVSSVLSDGFYDADTDRMYLRFHSGDVRQYNKVPISVFNGLRWAPSPGAYFNTHIKNRFPSSLLDDDVTFERRTIPAPDMTAPVVTLNTYDVVVEINGSESTVTVEAKTLTKAAKEVRKHADALGLVAEVTEVVKVG